MRSNSEKKHTHTHITSLHLKPRLIGFGRLGSASSGQSFTCCDGWDVNSASRAQHSSGAGAVQRCAGKVVAGSMAAAAIITLNQSGGGPYRAFRLRLHCLGQECWINSGLFLWISCYMSMDTRATAIVAPTFKG